jgi:hypothetical protein
MVADAEALVADEPDVPILESVTQSRHERKQQHESTSGGPWPPCSASGKH